jgi:hypothetical protein
MPTTNQKNWLIYINIYLTFASSCIIIQFEYFNQQDATVSQVYYLMFMCGSTRFGHHPAHHQEHTTALGASGFTVGEKWLQLPLSNSKTGGS